ncbi:hypothetical protein ACTWM0_19455 [Pseudomonas machongensis]
MKDLNQLTQANSTKAASKPLSFKVVSQSADYPAPTVREVTGGTLKPFDARNGATVVVTYPTMNSSHKIIVRVAGHNEAATFTSEPQNGSASGSVNFTVPAPVIGASQGRSVIVQYVVTRGSNEPRLSVPLTLTVTELSAEQLPAPEVPEATEGILDLGAFEGDATVKVSKTIGDKQYAWPLAGEGQLYWVVAEVRFGGNLLFEVPLASGEALNPTQVTQGLELKLKRGTLDLIKDGSELNVIVEVAYDKSQNGRRLELPRTKLDVTDGWPSSGYEDFRSFLPQELITNKSLTSKTSGITITPVTTVCHPPICPALWREGHPLISAQSLTIEFTTKRSFHKLLVEYYLAGRSSHIIELFNGNESLGRFPMPASPGPIPKIVEFNAPAGTTATHALLSLQTENWPTGVTIQSLRWS